MLGVSRRTFAKTRGTTEAAIRKHVKTGVLANAILSDGSLDAAVADKLLTDALTRPKAGAVPVGLHTARMRHLRAVLRQQFDELSELRSTHIRPDDAQQVWMEASEQLAVALRPISAFAAEVAGLPANEVHRVLKLRINELLTVASAAFEHEFAEKRARMAARGSPELDLDGLSAVQLNALKANQAAEILELNRAVTQGILRHTHDFTDETEEKSAVAKSLLNALPGRVAQQVAVSTIAEAEALISSEIEQLLATLKTDWSQPS